MQVILLERIARLGQMGDEVRVRDGYARNFLLPQGKALRVNEANRKHFESQRAQLEARNLERRQEAEAVGEKLAGQSFVVVRQAGETGHLYGSVNARDLAEIMETGGFSVARSQVALAQPIKTIGMHEVTIHMHAEVDVTVNVNVARSEDEAERQAQGQDVTRLYDDDDEDDEIEAAEADELEASAEGEEGDETAATDGEADEADAASGEESTPPAAG